MISFAWGSATDIGRIRQVNQDQALVVAPLFVVADGMGGHSGGEVASAIAVDELAKLGDVQSLEELVDLVQRANREIVDRSRIDIELRGMGTTVCVLLGMRIDGEDRLGVANVGDSRMYLRLEDELLQLTEDHSLVEALVRDGRLSRADAAKHPQRNIVTRALGIDQKVLVDAWELVPVVGDRYLIASDGLFNELEADEILEILHRLPEPSEAAAALVEDACLAGGHDNVTVVVVDIIETDAEVIDPPHDRVIFSRKAVPESVLRLDRVSADDVDHGPDDPHPDEIAVDRSVERAPLVTWRLGVFVAAVLIVLAVLLTSVIGYARSSYFIGIDGNEVVIFRGRPDGVLWFDPTVEEPLVLTIADLDPIDLTDLDDGVVFDSLDEAREYGSQLAARAQPEP